jgi:hypothetical protein
MTSNPQARHVVVKAPVRVHCAALPAAFVEEFVEVVLHVGARLARYGCKPQ